MLRRFVIALIRAYQLLVSPLLGPVCRFEPSCSRYACACVAHHGVLQGGALAIRRLSRCHPWNPGGYDPPPPAPGSLPSGDRPVTGLHARPSA